MSSSGATPAGVVALRPRGRPAAAPRCSLVRRPIIDLTTGDQAGWTVEDDEEVGEPGWLDDLLLELSPPGATATGRLHGPWIVVPWSAVDESWLQLDSEEAARRLRRTGIAIQLPPTRSRGEFEIAAHLLAASGFPTCLAFDGNEDALRSMRRRLDVRIVRTRLAPRHHRQGAGSLPPAIRRLADDGIAVVVDGIDDAADGVTEELVRAGIRLGQGPRFDRRSR
jgi:hypothetical protein